MNTTRISPSSGSNLPRIVAGLLGVLLPLAAVAQTTTPAVSPVPAERVEPTLKSSDRSFMEKAAKASMSEVDISRVAVERTSNPDVKRFAQMMIEDHGTAVDQLGSLASRKNVSLPAKDAHPSKWEKRDAKDFDQEYLDKMIDDHKEAVKLFEKQARDGSDGDTVTYARKYLPKLQAHLQHAVDLKRSLTNKH